MSVNNGSVDRLYGEQRRVVRLTAFFFFFFFLICGRMYITEVRSLINQS